MVKSSGATGRGTMTSMVERAISDRHGGGGSLEEDPTNGIVGGPHIAGTHATNNRKRGGGSTTRGNDGGVDGDDDEHAANNNDVGAGGKRAKHATISGRGKATQSAIFPGRVPASGRAKVVSRSDAPKGWTELCKEGFDDKKSARVKIVEWYSKESGSSSRLIIDKWRESKVRYVLRCGHAMPKRSQKPQKEVCQEVGAKCAMCVHVKLDRATNSWFVCDKESVPLHDLACLSDNKGQPNVSSQTFADALVEINRVAEADRAAYVAQVLQEKGYKISSGTKQRAVALALKQHSAGGASNGARGTLR